MDRTARKRLGEILVAEGLLAPADLQRALTEQKAGGRRERLGNTIVRLGLTSELGIAQALAKQLGLATVDLNEVEPSPAAIALVSRSIADRHHALPIRVDPGDVLVVAMADPTNVVALDDIKLTSGMRTVRPVVATGSAIDSALRRAYATDTDAVSAVENAIAADTSAPSLAELANQVADLKGTGDDQPIIRLTNSILADAVRTRVSDIHIEPMADGIRVRYRIDGMLREVMRVPKSAGAPLISRLKILSKLDIAERRRPQDGRAMVKIDGQEVDLRVSSMPAMHGEVIVMRLLRKGSQRLMIADLGLATDHQGIYEESIQRPQGLVIITGPTGSGKTTTLYAGLTTITEEIRNVITLEDPIEYELDGVNQSQMAPKIGFTFAAGLRTVLRQDPDVVMVGEIRDLETAELAMEASFTGHLVLSTLHTNDAVSSIMRMVDLGVDRFLIASSLILIVAQRLARRVCDDCGHPDQPDPEDLRKLGMTAHDIVRLGGKLRRGEGCNTCDRTGFNGRVACLEMLQISPEIREQILEGANETQISRTARQQGLRTLRADGILKALAGITTLDEIIRISPDDAISTAEQGERDLTNLFASSQIAATLEAEPQLRNLTATPATVAPAVGAPPVAQPSAPAPAAQAAPVAPTAPVAPVAAPPVAVQPEPKAAPALGQDPLSTAAAAGRRIDPSEIAAGSSEPARQSITGRNVLVIDHEGDLHQTYETMFSDANLLIVTTGQEGLDALQTLTWDAVVVEMQLPDLTGLDVTERIRRHPAHVSVPIMLVTSLDDGSAEIDGMIAGADDTMLKPFDAAILEARIVTSIRRHARL